jgi:hypothetical protein
MIRAAALCALCAAPAQAASTATCGTAVIQILPAEGQAIADVLFIIQEPSQAPHLCQAELILWAIPVFVITSKKPGDGPYEFMVVPAPNMLALPPRFHLQDGTHRVQIFLNQGKES